MSCHPASAEPLPCHRGVRVRPPCEARVQITSASSRADRRRARVPVPVEVRVFDELAKQLVREPLGGACKLPKGLDALSLCRIDRRTSLVGGPRHKLADGCSRPRARVPVPSVQGLSRTAAAGGGTDQQGEGGRAPLFMASALVFSAGASLAIKPCGRGSWGAPTLPGPPCGRSSHQTRRSRRDERGEMPLASAKLSVAWARR